jgi:hypothetical protein
MSMAEDTRKRPDFSSEQSFDSPRETGIDPLAELARLIGQSDPFTDIAKQNSRKPFDAVKSADRPAPEWLARPVSSEHDEYDAPAAPHQAYAQPDYRSAQGEPQPQTAHVGGDQHAEGGDYSEQAGEYDHYSPDDRYRVALPSGQHDPDSYYAEDGHMPPQGEESVVHRRRGGLITIAAVVGLAVVGTAGAFGYRAFMSPSSGPTNPPVIKADPTPPKTVPAPAAPATTASVDQGKPFQDRIGAPPAPERVVPREEQPVSLPTGPAAPRVTAPQPSAQAVAPLISSPPPTSASEPKKVKTVTIRQDYSGADSAAMASAPAAAPPAQTRAPATKQPVAAPIAIAPQSDSSRTKMASRTPPAQAAGGAYVVQVSAQKTEDEARASYQTLQQKYPSVLSGREANIRRADLGDKGVYFRAQIGPFATADQANSFCGDLKAAGGQCIVQKN